MKWFSICKVQTQLNIKYTAVAQKISQMAISLILNSKKIEKGPHTNSTDFLSTYFIYSIWASEVIFYLNLNQVE